MTGSRVLALAIAALATAPLAIAPAACRGSAEAVTPAGPPERAVEEMFSVMNGGDCQRLFAVVGGKLEERYRSIPCEQLMADMAHQRPALDTIIKVEVDGRFPSRRLVYTRWTAEGSTRTTIAKVEQERGAWVVVEF